MQGNRSRLLTATIVACAVGCGHDDADTYEGFIAALSRRECEQALRCDSGSPEDAVARAQSAVAVCNPELWRPRPGGLTPTAMRNGTFRYDPEAGRACLDSYDDLCAGGRVDACERHRVGTIPVGGSCMFFAECVSGRCSGSGLECGVCEASVPDGGRCETVGLCGPGSFCDGGICRSFFATPGLQADLGEPCDLGEDIYCAPSLYCGEDDTCHARRSLGEACDLGLDGCEDGSICRLNAADEPRCVAIVVTEVAGATCGDVDDAYVTCARAARLECEDGRCGRLIGQGEAGSECRYDFECESTLCAFIEGGTCVEGGLPNGSACDRGEQCASFYCVDDRCEDIPQCT